MAGKAQELVTTPAGCLPFHKFTPVAPSRTENPYYRRVIHPVYNLQSQSEFWKAPLKGTLNCAYCPYPITGLPYPGVDEYDHETGMGVSYMVYCNLVCRKSHILELGGSDMPRRLEWLAIVASDVYDHHGDIPVIHKHAVFKAFGGKFSHEDYLAAIGLQPFPKLRGLPFVPQRIALEEDFKDPFVAQTASTTTSAPKAEERFKALQQTLMGPPAPRAPSTPKEESRKRKRSDTAGSSSSPSLAAFTDDGLAKLMQMRVS